jgi:class 3 adenylate cyclase/tetratricopeptide (TPR) repeat protein
MAGEPTTEDLLDELLERAVAATQGLPAEALEPVLPPGPVAEGTAAIAPASRDELRRLTIMFSDLVGSTSLSGRLDPETYRTVLSTYKDTCRRVIADLDGHLVHTRGDGMLAVFGYPTAHEDDALRAVKAGLAIHRELAIASEEVHEQVGAHLTARIGVHRGLTYLERDTDELYGLAVNIAARVQEAAAPGTVAITEEVRRLVGDAVITSPLGTTEMKGVERAPALHRAIEERAGARAGRRWPSPLVGRDAELEELRARHATATASDAPTAVLLVGDPGVGKSRLIGAFLDELPRATTVLELRGSPFHRRQGLQPVRELLWDLAELRGDRSPAEQLATLRAHLDERGLAHLLPLLAPVAGLEPEAGYQPVEVEPARLQGLIADAVHELLASSFPQGGVLVVEDVHWLDDASRAAIARLVSSGPAGLLVLLASRQPRALGVAVDVVELPPLGADGCLALVRHHAPDLAEPEARQVVERSDGIPLFVEELVRAGAADPGPADRREGADEELPIPSTLYEPLYARLSALDDARVVASAAATIGRTVHLDLLARVSGVSAEELDRALTGLMESHVLEPDHGDGRAVRFRHELVRLVAYELEPPSGRQRFHAMAARALASGDVADGADWSVIAGHHRRSGEPKAAAAALQRAADDARRRGSMEEARSHFDRALDWLADAPQDLERDRLEVRLRLARAFLAVSTEGFGSEHATLDHLRCLELSIGRPESAELYQTLIATWGYWANGSHLDRAWKTSTALRPLSMGSRSHMLPTNEAGFGMIELYRGRFPEGVRRLADAVGRIPDVGVDPSTVPDAWSMAADPLAAMYELYAVGLTWVGDLRAAAEQHAAARQRCQELPFPMGPFTEAYMLLVWSMACAHQGDAEGARTAVAEAREIADRHGFDAWLFWASILRAASDAAFAQPDQATALLAQSAMSADMFHAMGVRLFSASMRTVLATVALEAGLRDTAVAMADQALALADETGMRMSVHEALRVRALAGPDGAAEAGLLEALRVAEADGAAISAVRIAADLVRTAGAAHRPALEAALARIASDRGDLDRGAPVLAEARALLADQLGGP